MAVLERYLQQIALRSANSQSQCIRTIIACLLLSNKSLPTLRSLLVLMHTSEFKQITKNDGTKSSAYLLIPHGVLHAVGVLLKAVPGVNLLLLKIVL